MLEENKIASIGFKRSGIGSGDVDYSIKPYEIEKLNETDAKDLKKLLPRFYRTMDGYIHERLTGKKKRWIFGRHFLMVAKNPSKYYYWPIKFGWASYEWTNFFNCHGWQIDKKYGWTLHVGKFQIRFGSRTRE